MTSNHPEHGEFDGVEFRPPSFRPEVLQRPLQDGMVRLGVRRVVVGTR
jgi:hypothetical protein